MHPSPTRLVDLFLKGTTHAAAVDTDGYLANFPEQSFLHHIYGTQKTATITSLLSTNEEHLIGVFSTGVPYQLILFQG